MKILNHLRIESGYTIADLARMMDVDDEVACRWLCGSAYPNPDEIERLATIFEVDPLSLQPLPSKQPRRSDKLRVKITTTGGRIRGSERMHRKHVGS